MKTLQLTIVVFYLTSVFFFSCQKSKSDKQIEVKINPNVETVACLYNLTQKVSGMRYGYGSPPLREKTIKQFSRLKNHPAVQMTEYLLNRGLWHIPVWAALHSSPFPNGKLRYELPQWLYKQMSSKGDMAEGRRKINEYIEMVNDFYIQARFDDFLKQNDNEYQKIKGHVTKNLPDKNFIAGLEQYYGKENAGYILVPSPIMPEFSGFGAGISTDKGMIVLNIFGASIKKSVKDSIEKGKRKFAPDDFTFNDPQRIRELTVHEFGHSFVNPVAEKYRNEINKYAYLYESVREKMTKAGYREWYNCLVEHIVRAGEVRITLAMGYEKNSENLRRDYIKNYGFVYLEDVIAGMKIYEQNRKRFKTFDDYFSELLTVFAEIDTSGPDLR
ncbi:MAG: DUF4932 domain-containing protein [Calditrichaeota bacterium]|nr:DUF4932 domain-containing protein [Calditrichota bacterium]